MRVVRGSTAKGYTYAGLYRVDRYWMERGRAGFQICRFRLEAIEADGASSGPAGETNRIKTTILRIVRDTQISKKIKELNGFACQICGTRLSCSAGDYAEGAHIQPLGKPHHGPDVQENLLCLCPNHHVLLDYGGFVIADDFSIIGLEGYTKLQGKTKPDCKYLAYHRALFPTYASEDSV